MTADPGGAAVSGDGTRGPGDGDAQPGASSAGGAAADELVGRLRAEMITFTADLELPPPPWSRTSGRAADPARPGAAGEFVGRLRAEMAAFTADLHVAPGLLAVAAEGRRSRRRPWRRGLAAGAGATMLAAAAVTVAVLVPGTAAVTRHGLAQPARLDAYVLRRTRAGTAAATARILESRGVGPDGVTWVSFSDQQAGRRSFVQLGPGGQPVTAYCTADRDGTLQAVTIAYGLRAWWTTSTRPAATGPGQADGSLPAQFGLPGTAAQIRVALAAGTLTVSGRQEIGGRDTLHVVVSAGTPTAHRRLDMWLDPVSYLPVRIALAAGSALRGFHEDLSWLPVTPAGLARLTIGPPSGFAHLARPPARAPVTNGGAG